jgi:hypothetical protein
VSNLADTYVPFDTGPGATATPARWRSMSRGFQWNGIIPGYATQFAATIANGVVTIQPGAVWVDGFYGEITVNHTVSSAGLGPGLIVLRADPVARTIGFVYLPGAQGTVLPNQPPPNQATGTYEIPLYYVTTATAFLDVRQFATATNDNYRPASPSTGPYNNSNSCARGRLYRTNPYTTITTVTNYGFDSVSYGALFWSGYTFICPYADDYLVIGQTGFAASAAGQWYNMWIRRNSNDVSFMSSLATAGGTWCMVNVSDIIPCKAGDSLTITHRCSTNGLQGLVGQSGSIAFFAVRALSR